MVLEKTFENPLVEVCELVQGRVGAGDRGGRGQQERVQGNELPHVELAAPATTGAEFVKHRERRVQANWEWTPPLPAEPSTMLRQPQAPQWNRGSQELREPSYQP